MDDQAEFSIVADHLSSTMVCVQSSPPHRILVLGKPGAGKSTLATRLARQLGVPCVHLDDWRRDEHGRVPRSELVLRAQQLAEHDSWVAEGLFITWTGPLMATAEVIVLLDPPRRTLAYRIWRRRFSDAEERRTHSLRATVRFTWASVRGYPLRTLVGSEVNLPPSRRAFEEVLAPYANHVVTIRKGTQDAALDSFGL